MRSRPVTPGGYREVLTLEPRTPVTPVTPPIEEERVVGEGAGAERSLRLGGLGGSRGYAAEFGLGPERLQTSFYGIGRSGVEGL